MPLCKQFQQYKHFMGQCYLHLWWYFSRASDIILRKSVLGRFVMAILICHVCGLPPSHQLRSYALIISCSQVKLIGTNLPWEIKLEAKRKSYTQEQ